jgi:hypothetical protein
MLAVGMRPASRQYAGRLQRLKTSADVSNEAIAQQSS